MNNVQKVLNVAESEKGYLEKKNQKDLYDKTANSGKNNYTKYWADLAPGMQGQPWCQAFVIWCFKQAYRKDARKLLCVDNSWSYYTPTASGYFKQKGQWFSKDPKPGDIVYFKNSTRICHVGIVKAVSANQLITIEGNTSGASGVIANGGGVCEKTYDLSNNRIAGYGRPLYDVEPFKPHWEKVGPAWYYRIGENQNAHGWKKIRNADGKIRWYYFEADGKMCTGWKTIGNELFYLEEHGDFVGACYTTDSRGAQSIMIVTE